MRVYRAKIDWDFKDPVFRDLNGNYTYGVLANCSGPVKSLIEFSSEITSLYELEKFRMSLLDYVKDCEDISSEEVKTISQIVRALLIFKVLPLSEKELEKLNFLRLNEENLAQIKSLVTDETILEFNRCLLKIAKVQSHEIPTLDTSDFYLMGANVIETLVDALNFAYMSIRAPILRSAYLNICLVAPQLIFTSTLDESFKTLGYIIRKIEPEHLEIFCKVLDTRFDFELASHVIKTKFNVEDLKIQSPTECLLAAVIFSAYFNKKSKGQYDKNAKFMMDLMLMISKSKTALIRFLKGLDVTRLLYKMQSLYQEFQRRSSGPGSKDLLENISHSVQDVLLERLNETQPLELKKNIACMIIEHITLWTSSNYLILNLAHRWASFTNDSLHACKVCDVLTYSLSEKPFYMWLKANQKPKPARNQFLATTCNGLDCFSDRDAFMQSVDQLKVVHSEKLGMAKKTEIENIADATGFDFNKLQKIFICMYFNTSKSKLERGVLYNSFHNLYHKDLTDGQELNNNKTTSFAVTVTSISQPDENQPGKHSVIIVKSLSRLYSDETINAPRFDADAGHRRIETLKRRLSSSSVESWPSSRILVGTPKKIETRSLPYKLNMPGTSGDGEGKTRQMQHQNSRGSSKFYAPGKICQRRNQHKTDSFTE